MPDQEFLIEHLPSWDFSQEINVKATYAKNILGKIA